MIVGIGRHGRGAHAVMFFGSYSKIDAALPATSLPPDLRSLREPLSLTPAIDAQGDPIWACSKRPDLSAAEQARRPWLRAIARSSPECGKGNRITGPRRRFGALPDRAGQERTPLGKA